MNDLKSELSEDIIAKLQAKIKELQRQICDRTRSYLLQRGKKKVYIEQADEEVQTQQIPCKQLNISSMNHIFISPTITESPMKSSFCHESDDGSNNRYEELQNRKDPSEFDASQVSFENKEEKEKLGKILENLAYQQKLLFQEQLASSSVSSTYSQRKPESNDTEDLSDKEKRRMRKQIKKLRAHLQFEIKVNNYAKQGLLISEEENYQFRLKIKELKNKLKQNITAANDSLQKAEIKLRDQKILSLQATIKDLTNKKQEYLDISIKEKAEIQKLKQEINHLKNYINTVESNQSFSNKAQDQFEIESINKKIKFSNHFIQLMKKKSFDLSQKIPITNQSQKWIFFQPENQEQIINALKHVEDFCAAINKWEKQKNQSIKKEKNIFLTFLKNIIQKLDQNGKNIIGKELAQIEEMNHYIHCLMQHNQIEDKNVIDPIIKLPELTQNIPNNDINRVQ